MVPPFSHQCHFRWPLPQFPPRLCIACPAPHGEPTSSGYLGVPIAYIDAPKKLLGLSRGVLLYCWVDGALAKNTNNSNMLPDSAGHKIVHEV